jgi:hypothetical protein
VNPFALALAVVFGWAGVAKLAHGEDTARSFAAFGLPWPERLAVAVPAAELVLAAVLVAAPAVGAVLSLAVLAGFSTLLALARRRGRTAGCGCFGGARPAPPSVELARNAVLLVVALVALLTT